MCPLSKEQIWMAVPKYFPQKRL